MCGTIQTHDISNDTETETEMQTETEAGPEPETYIPRKTSHGTQIRLLALMSVEAGLGRAESAPETGKVDDQVCSVESATEEENDDE